MAEPNNSHCNGQPFVAVGGKEGQTGYAANINRLPGAAA